MMMQACNQFSFGQNYEQHHPIKLSESILSRFSWGFFSSHLLFVAELLCTRVAHTMQTQSLPFSFQFIRSKGFKIIRITTEMTIMSIRIAM